MRNQGQGHIRQRSHRSWELKFDLGRDPVTGKRISRFVTFQGTKREAQAELNRLLNRRNGSLSMLIAESPLKPQHVTMALCSIKLFHALAMYPCAS
jgi:hypothetical protein